MGRDSHKTGVWVAGLVGLGLGGPISGALAAICFYILARSRKQSKRLTPRDDTQDLFIIILSWTAIGSIAMPASWAVGNSMGWNFDLVALVQSSGRFKSYRDWSEGEKAEAEAKRQAKIKQREYKNKVREDAIASHPDFMRLRSLVDNGICMDVKYFGHLAPDAGYMPLIYGRRQTQVMMSPLAMPGEMEAKWESDPQYKNVCFTLETLWRKKPTKPSEYVKHSKQALVSSDTDKYIKLHRDNDRTTTKGVDCNGRTFRASYNSNVTSSLWSTWSIEPFISVELEELDKICRDPGISAMLRGNIYSVAEESK
jgi:hypothetical protein